MSDLLSEQLAELLKETKDSLAKINTLIENRGAWKDGIEGCRESATILAYVNERLMVVGTSAQALETALASARKELDRWSKMHAELSKVERELRSETEAQRVAIDEQGLLMQEGRTLFRNLMRDMAKFGKILEG